MSALALKFLLGGWGLLKKLFELLWNVRLPAIFAVAALVFAAVQWGEARHEHKLRARAETALKLEKRGRAADRKAWADGQIAARKLAQEQKARTEASYARIQKEKADEHKARLADARALLAERLRNRTSQSGGGPADLRGTPDASPRSDGVPAAAIVDVTDLELCTAAVVKLEGWQFWWASIQATQSTGGNK